jgi:hypothetical protein
LSIEGEKLEITEVYLAPRHKYRQRPVAGGWLAQFVLKHPLSRKKGADITDIEIVTSLKEIEILRSFFLKKQIKMIEVNYYNEEHVIEVMENLFPLPPRPSRFSAQEDEGKEYVKIRDASFDSLLNCGKHLLQVLEKLEPCQSCPIGAIHLFGEEYSAVNE